MGKHNIRTCVYISIYMYIYIYEHHYKLFSILTRLRSSRYNNSPTNMYIHIYIYMYTSILMCVFYT